LHRLIPLFRFEPVAYAAAPWRTCDGLFLCASVKLPGMKLQFSLATLLVCMTVVAVVCVVCATVPVRQSVGGTYMIAGLIHTDISEWDDSPEVSDVLRRFSIWGPISGAVTLFTLWLIRRLQSRRDTEPPVG
jgi:hypothetical protein